MVDLATSFTAQATPDAKTAGTDTTTVAAPTPAPSTSALVGTKGTLTASFVKTAGDSGFSITGRDPKKSGLFAQQVVTPAYKLPNPK